MDVANARFANREEVTNCIRWRALTDAFCIDVEAMEKEEDLIVEFVDGDVEIKSLRDSTFGSWHSSSVDLYYP